MEGEPGHLLHRVQLHAPPGQRLPVALRARRRASCRWAAPTSGATSPLGIDLIRRTLGPAGLRAHLAPAHQERRHQVRQDRRAARSGSTRTRPARTSSASSGSRPTTPRCERYLLQFTLRPVDEVRVDARAQHAEAPERRVAQRALARRAHRARPRPGGRRRRPRPPPTCSSGAIPPRRRPEAFEAVAGPRCPTSAGRLDAARRRGRAPGQHRSGLLEQRRPADARPSAAITGQRPPARRGRRPSAPAELLHGRYLLLRKGQDHLPPGRNFSLAEVDGRRGSPDSVSLRPRKPRHTWPENPRAAEHLRSSVRVLRRACGSLKTEERTKNASAGDRPPAMLEIGRHVNYQRPRVPTRGCAVREAC